MNTTQSIIFGLGHASLQIADGGALPTDQRDLQACIQGQQIEDPVAHCERTAMQ